MGLTQLLTREENIINTPTLKIQGNVLSFSDYFMQISNISQVSVAPAKKQSYPISSFVLIILGIFLLTTNNSLGVVVGILLAGFGGYIIYKIYTNNANRGNNLFIELNSGNVFYINFKERDFLNKAMEVLQNCANNVTSNYVIDINNSVITVGDQNSVINGELENGAE